MRSIATVLLLTLCVAAPALAQDADWRYDREIRFPEADTAFVLPYLTTVADDGTLYVVSSRATDTTAHNALWKAAPGADTFELVQDYTANRDGAVKAVRGVTTIGNDVVVGAHGPPQPGGLGYGVIYYYPDGDVARRRTYSSAAGNGGYGTFIYAVDATDDGYVFATLSYQTSMRLYNFTDPSAGGYGGWVPMDPVANTAAGGHDPGGISALRDVAVIPGADYMDASTPFFTSRNRSPEGVDPSFNGAVNVWTGGTVADPAAYDAKVVSDFAGELSLSPFVATGITADSEGRLWVAGPDSTRRWVKAYEVDGTFALEAFALPSATSMENPDAEGAPFRAPNDVALNREESHAYVSDLFARRVFVFVNRAKVSVEDEGVPTRFALGANYPNPFNPTTVIPYEMAEPGHVRLTVADVLGREVAVLVDGPVAPGTHTAHFEAAGLPSGVYFYRLEAFGATRTRALMLIK